MEDIKGIRGVVLLVFQDINKESGMNESYKPKLTKTDGTYKNNIKIPLTFFMEPNLKVFAT